MPCLSVRDVNLGLGTRDRKESTVVVVWPIAPAAATTTRMDERRILKVEYLLVRIERLIWGFGCVFFQDGWMAKKRLGLGELPYIQQSFPKIAIHHFHHQCPHSLEQRLPSRYRADLSSRR